MNPDTIQFQCGFCRTTLTVPAQMAGVSGPCPSCGQTVTSPSAAPAPVPQWTPPAAAAPQPSWPPAPLSPMQGEPQAPGMGMPTSQGNTGLPPRRAPGQPPSHDLDQRLRQSDALGRRAGRASRHALGRYPCRTARRRNTQSVPPHSRIPSSTKHDTAEQCRRRHDGNALIPACGIPAWERSFRGAFATNDAAAPGQRRYVLEPGGRHAL